MFAQLSHPNVSKIGTRCLRESGSPGMLLVGTAAFMRSLRSGCNSGSEDMSIRSNLIGSDPEPTRLSLLFRNTHPTSSQKRILVLALGQFDRKFL